VHAWPTGWRSSAASISSHAVTTIMKPVHSDFREKAPRPVRALANPARGPVSRLARAALLRPGRMFRPCVAYSLDYRLKAANMNPRARAMMVCHVTMI